MIHFNKVFEQIITKFSIFKGFPEVNFYIIRDVFGRISVYIEDKTENDAILKVVQQILNDSIGIEWTHTVEFVNSSSTLIENLKIVTTKIEGYKNIFFGERHLTKLNWFRKKGNGTISNKTKIVTFYSFKGGVGRTTSLVMTALHLIRQGKKVVLVDFDLEAPGLSSILVPENKQFPQYGVLDYLIESQIYSKSNIKLDINDYVYTIQDREVIGSNGGQLYVLPAANLGSDNISDYLEKMGRVDFNTPNYFQEINPISSMLSQLSERFSPDFIFLDARTGVNDVGGLTLTQFTDISFLLFFGNEQNIAGMKIVLPKVIEAEIPFYLINSPVPMSEEEAKDEKEFYLENAYNILSECGYYNETYLPDLYEDNADHYPYSIYYDPQAALINSKTKIVRLLEDNGRANVYLKLAEQISSYSIEEKSVPLTLKDNVSNRILKSVSEIMSGKLAASENEFKSEDDLINKFYPLKEHRFIFEADKFLILGPKGSGKTALFSVLEHRNYAKHLATYLGLSTESIKGTHWITGLKQSKDFPSIENFESIGRNNDISVYRRYWKLLALKSISKYLGIKLPVFEENIINDLNYVSKIREMTNDIGIAERIEDYLEIVDDYLQSKNEKIIIVYDALDVLLKKEYRGKMVSALILLWYEYLSRYKNIRVKIFLRDDIFRSEVKDITDKVKLRNFSEKLAWTYDELLAMIWKRMSQKSNELAKIFIEAIQSLGLLIRNDENLGYIPKADEEINKAILKVLVGERMATGKAAYSYNWIRNHLADTNEQIVPRSMLKLFASAASKELENIDGISLSHILIRPKSLESVMPEVSLDRVTDLLDEYKEYEAIFENLKEYLPRFPANEDDLKDALRKCGVPEGKEISTIDDLVKIGVMKPYQRKKIDPIRYHIPDIFLIGLGLSRVGLKAIK